MKDWLNSISIKPPQDGVYQFSEQQPFEAAYLEARAKEGRVLLDQEVATLPKLPSTHPLASEWKRRYKSTARILNHIQKQSTNGPWLDLGCGNGWFTHALAAQGKFDVVGVDLNQEELAQGARVFRSSSNLYFCHANIFEVEFPKQTFQGVVLNASAQYFPDFDRLINRLKKLLLKGGEIHIIDTPFYSDEELPEAKQRTLAYYTGIQCAKMAENYFHRSFAELQQHQGEILYRPASGIKQKIARLSGQLDSPFPWVKFLK